jgi:transcriptional regulator with XRE-family HTH domain
MKTFGQQIRERRQALELTQRAVADRVGATPAYISLIESGKSLPPPRPLVEALAQALELDPAKLWQAAFEERKQRFLQKAQGRLPSAVRTSRRAKVPVADLPDVPTDLRPLVAKLQEDPELLDACLDLQAVYETGGESWIALRTLLAHHAREAERSGSS